MISHAYRTLKYLDNHSMYIFVSTSRVIYKTQSLGFATASCGNILIVKQENSEG